jgi:signal transduction histidine kinase
MKLEAEIDALNQKILALESENERLKLIELDLMETNATKDKFLAIISHDLRNPINTIVGLSEMLEKQVQKTIWSLLQNMQNISSNQLLKLKAFY